MTEDYTQEIIEEFRNLKIQTLSGDIFAKDIFPPMLEMICIWIKEKLTSLSQREHERGFEAGHAKERWLKEEVEKEAYERGYKNGYESYGHNVQEEIEDERARLRGEVEKMRENIINSLALEINHPARIRKENTNEIINKFLFLLTPKEDKER